MEENGARYTKEVFVAEGAAATVTFYLPPQCIINDFFQDYDASLRLYLKDKEQRTVKSTTINGNNTNANMSFGILSAEPDRYNRLIYLAPGGQGSTPLIIPLKGHHFDHYMYMENLAMIVVRDTETLQLTPQQPK